MAKYLLTEINRMRGLIGLNESVTQEDYLTEITSKDAKQQYYTNIDDNLYNAIVGLDPTYNRDTDHFGKYNKWLLQPKNVAILSKKRQEDLYKVKEDLAIFDRLKKSNKLPIERKDINMFDVEGLLDYIFDSYTHDANFNIDSITSNTQDSQNIKNANADKYIVGDFTIINPKTEEAACLYGKGSKWCTAAEYHNAFDGYNRRGKIWILIDKNHPNDKLQFHFEDEQFMDVKDREIDIFDFFGDNDDVYNFFIKSYPSLNFTLAKYAITYTIGSNSMSENFDAYYSNKFSDDQKDILVTEILNEMSDSDNEISHLIDMLYQIKYDFKSFKSQNYAGYKYALEGAARYDIYADWLDGKENTIAFINIFGGLNGDDVRILYDELHNDNFKMMHEIITSYDNGQALLNEFILDNDLNDEFKTTNEMLSAIVELKDTYPTYPVIDNKLVRITVLGTNYEDETLNVSIERKDDQGNIIKTEKGDINYKNIYTYLNNYSLFEHTTRIVKEVRKMRNLLMELTNTELKVKFIAGVQYRDITMMPEIPTEDEFTGNETGKIIPDEQLNAGEIRAVLDDGRIVITTDNAVGDVENLLDLHSREEFTNNQSGDAYTGY